MLVLSRKQRDQIRIGEGICITLLSVHGGVIQVGIEAPPDVRILRGELMARLEVAPASTTEWNARRVAAGQ